MATRNYPIDDLSVCLACYQLTGTYRDKEHRCRCQTIGDGWRETEWEGYDIAALIDLCYLCARDTMFSGTRWSWYACETCREVNVAAGASLGRGKWGALPLGMHSMMNGVAFSLTEDTEPSEFATALIDLHEIWKRLSDWRLAEGSRLASPQGWPAEKAQVPLAEWLTTFPTSYEASRDALVRFVGVEPPPMVSESLT